MSRIMLRYTANAASEDTETSFCREPQTENTAGLLPCRSKLALQLTGQQDGVSSLCLKSIPKMVLSTCFPRDPLLIQQSFG